MKNQLATLADIERFDTVIDVRTPLEFADDHLPGAINAPVLSNEERVVVGTMYKQVSPFEATKYGAALVAKNIAQHLQTLFADKPINWKPLIYCWRGGKRSGSMTTWFRLIGWKACQLQGGYKVYRHQVLENLGVLPGRFDFRVLGRPDRQRQDPAFARAGRSRGADPRSGESGAASRFAARRTAGRGPAQPERCSTAACCRPWNGSIRPRPVFVEAESRKIGQVQLPDALMQKMAESECIRVEASLEDRVDFLCEDYATLLDAPEPFKALLSCLVELHGKQVIARWHEMIDARARAELFRELIERHYDPAYRRSSHGLFRKLPQARPFDFRPNAGDLTGAARRLLVLFSG